MKSILFNIINRKIGISMLLLTLVLGSIKIFAESSNLLLGYKLENPDKVIVLPSTLNEVSGVTRIDDKTVAFVQDENGILFLFDLIDGKIKQQYKFHIDGDYEGITKVNQTLYVLRSDGTLFEISNYTSPDFKLKSYITGIPANNNEGLCYDVLNNRLLIACKNSPGKGEEFKDKRMIYGFDLKSKKLYSQPVFSFDLSDIRKFISKKGINVPYHSKINGMVNEPIVRFRTSAIDFHPITKKLYLLSAADHLLFVFDNKGNPEHIEKLDPVMFNKSEGITFFENGDMLITNEAQNKKPTLLRFNYQLK